MSKFFKISESNLALDFVAGADPTGRSTYELSKKNVTNHTAHNIAGAFGGFTVGALATAGITSLGTMGIGKLIKGPTGRQLVDIGKDSLIIFNPKETKKVLKNFDRSINITKDITSSAAKREADTKKFIADVGMTPTKASIKGGAAMGTLAAATIGGAMNALSSTSQYSVGQEYRNKK